MRNQVHEVPITHHFLKKRLDAARTGGWTPAKWLIFCETLLPEFTLTLYEASSTVSKYITVARGGHSFRVRFSNHKPNHRVEHSRDCDFYVGARHRGKWQNTDAAIRAVREFFAKEEAYDARIAAE